MQIALKDIFAASKVHGWNMIYLGDLLSCKVQTFLQNKTLTVLQPFEPQSNNLSST